MNIAKLDTFDTANGPGIRVSVFVSGCTLNCKGCFNKEAHNFNFGTKYNLIREKLLKSLDNKYVAGLSILGGDPCEPKNIGAITELCTEVKNLFPDKTIWMWTGRTIEELKNNEIYNIILQLVDVIIDGRFIEELKDPNLKYRGSSNQKVLYKGIDF